MIIIVMALVMLFGFAALSVDAAAAWTQRRQNQGAVDTAAVAGALQTSAKTSAAAAQAAAESEVIRITYESLDPEMTFGAWQQLWHRTSAVPCSDPDAAAAGYTVASPKSDCITFTANGQQLTIYTVKAGDNLTKIGRKHAVTVDDLRRENQLQTDLIKIGQKLKIPPPRSESTQPDRAAPSPPLDPLDLPALPPVSRGSLPPSS